MDSPRYAPPSKPLPCPRTCRDGRDRRERRTRAGRADPAAYLSTDRRRRRPALVYFHGGGMVMGTNHSFEPLARDARRRQRCRRRLGGVPTGAGVTAARAVRRRLRRDRMGRRARRRTGHRRRPARGGRRQRRRLVGRRGRTCGEGPRRAATVRSGAAVSRVWIATWPRRRSPRCPTRRC